MFLKCITVLVCRSRESSCCSGVVSDIVLEEGKRANKLTLTLTVTCLSLSK